MFERKINRVTVLAIFVLFLILGTIPGTSESYSFGFTKETTSSENAAGTSQSSEGVESTDDEAGDQGSNDLRGRGITLKGSSASLPGGGTMQLLATDEDRDEFFDAEGETLAFAESGSRFESKQYKVRVVLRNLPTSNPGTIKIELAKGVSFVAGTTGENDTVLMSSLDSNGIKRGKEQILEYITGPYSLQKDDLYDPSLTKLTADTSLTGTVKEGTTSMTWEFQVQGDGLLAITDEIQDAIKVTLTRGSDETVISANAQYTFKIVQKNKTTRSYSVSNNAETLINDNMRFEYCAKTIGTYISTYECPEGVSMKLANGAEDYFTLTEEAGSPGKYTLRSKLPVIGGSHNDYYEPVLFVTALSDDQVRRGYVDVPATKRMYNIDGDVIYDAPYVRRLRVISDEENVYVGWKTSSDYLANGNTAGSNSIESVAWVDGFPCLGLLTIGNASSKDSKPKTIRLSFDKEKVWPRAVPVLLPPGNHIDSVTVTTNKRVDEVFPVDKTGKQDTTEFNPDNHLSIDELGLDDDEYFVSVKYDAGVLPAMWEVNQGRGSMFVGRSNLSVGNNVTGWIEAFDTDDETNTTGKGRAVLVVPEHSPNGVGNHWQIVTNASKSVTAGNTVEKWNYMAQSNSWERASFENYSVYICVPDNASIDRSKLSIKNHSKDITSYVDVSPLNVRTTDSGAGSKNYYKLDFSRVPLMDRLISLHIDSEGVLRGNLGLVINYDIITSKTTPEGTYPNEDNIFIELHNIPDIGRSDSYYVDGNPYGFEGVTGALFTEKTDKALTVIALTDILAKTTAKTGKMEEYISYDEQEPDTVLPIGVTAEDKVLINTMIRNNSGVAVSPGKVKIWQPIPKKNEDWGVLLKGTKDAEGNDTTKSPLTLKLLEKLEGINEDIWDIEYGIEVAPPDGDYTENWDENNGTWKKNPSDSELKRVNCIRLIQKAELPAENGEGKHYEENMTLHIAAESDKDQKGAIEILRAQVYRDLTVGDKVFTGMTSGDPTAVTPVFGRIKGTVFNDTNRNGIWDDGENPVRPGADDKYVVSLYGGPAGHHKQLIKQTVVDADGNYGFTGLATDDEGEEYYKDYYVIRITNMDGEGLDFHKINTPPADSEIIVTPKADQSESGKTRNNAFEHVSDSETQDEQMKGYAYSAPITPVDEDSFDYDHTKGGTYNMGVYAYGSSTITFKADTGKGKLVPGSQGEWVEAVDDDASDGTLSYKGSATDSIVWPKAEAVGLYKFIGWKLEGEEDSAARPAPKNPTFGYDEDVTYVAVFKELIQTEWKPILYKTLDGDTRTLEDDQFEFTISAEDGTPLPNNQKARNDSDGKIEFDSILFTENDDGKKFTYTFTEEPSSNSAYTIDGKTYTLNVAVRLVGDKIVVLKDSNILKNTNNPQADQLSVDWSIAGGWRCTNNGASYNNCSIYATDQTDMPSDSTSETVFNISDNSSRSSIWSQRNIPFYKGETYVLSGYFRVPSNSDKDSVRAVVYLSGTDSTGSVSPLNQNLTISKNDGWTYYEYTYIEENNEYSADDSIQMNYQVGITGAGSIEVADMKLTSTRDYESDDITFKNKSSTDVTVKKVDENRDYLPGATMRVLRGSTIVSAWMSGDEEHQLSLPDGRYTLREVYAPEGYYKANDIIFTVKGGKCYDSHDNEIDELVMVDEAKPVFKFAKADKETGELLEDAWMIINQNAMPVASFHSTDEYKELYLEDGKYEYAEKIAPEGYKMADPIPFTIENGKITEVNGETGEDFEAIVMEDEKAIGDLKITKTDADDKSRVVPNATYRFWGKDISGEEYDMEVTTDENGEILIKDLPMGDYHYQEIDAPKGYELDEKVYDLKFSGSQHEEDGGSQVTTNKQTCDTTIGDKKYHYFEYDDSGYKTERKYYKKLDNGGVYIGGNAKSGISEQVPFDDDINDFTKIIPYGNVFINTDKLHYRNASIEFPSGSPFHYIKSGDKEKNVKGETVSDSIYTGGVINDGSIMYLGKLTSYIKGVGSYYTDGVFGQLTDEGFQALVNGGDKADGTPAEHYEEHDVAVYGNTVVHYKDGQNIISNEKDGYLYRIVYYDAAILADGSIGDLVLTTNELIFESGTDIPENTPINVQRANDMMLNPLVYMDNTPSTIRYPRAVFSSQASQKKVYTGNSTTTDQSGTYKMINSLGVSNNFSVSLQSKDGKPAKGSISYSLRDLDMAANDDLWGRTEGYKYAEGMEIIDGANSIAVMPEYDHADGKDTVKEGWIFNRDHILMVEGNGSDESANGLRFHSGLLTKYRNDEGVKIRDLSRTDTARHDKIDTKTKLEDLNVIGDQYTMTRNDNQEGAYGFDTGFALLLDAGNANMRWTGSTGREQGQFTTIIFDSSVYNRLQQAHGTGGEMYVEGYDYTDGCSMTKVKRDISMGIGDSATLAIVPDENWHIEKITIDGTTVMFKDLTFDENGFAKHSFGNDEYVFVKDSENPEIVRVVFADVVDNHSILTDFTPKYDQKVSDRRIRYKVVHVYDDPDNLPQSVINTLPADPKEYLDGSQVKPMNPSRTTVPVKGGKWVFKGWDKDKDTIDGASVTFTGKWEFVPNGDDPDPVPGPDPTKPKYSEHYSYRGDLPKEVMDTIPTRAGKYYDGEEVIPADPSATVVKVEGGKWIFKGWDKKSEVIDGANARFEGIWEFVKDGASGDDSKKNGSYKRSGEAGTGDETDIRLWILLLISALMASVTVAVASGRFSKGN